MSAHTPDGEGTARIEARGEDGFAVIGRVDVETVRDLLDDALAMMVPGSPWRVDLSGADVRGSAVLALLIAWQRECVAAGSQIEFVAPSANLVAIAEASEVDEILGIA